MSEFQSFRTEEVVSRRGSLLAYGFGTSVLMWAVAYVGFSPSVNMVGPVGGLIALILVFSGWQVTRLAGTMTVIRFGLLLTGINFIIVTGLNGRSTTVQAMTTGVLWVLGFAVAAIALCLLGAALAGFEALPPRRSVAWSSRLATIVALTTLPLLISGGIVTGLEVGLIVPDWLTTFDYPMIFYPLEKMRENPGVYAEHFHRLWGLLVGLSVLTLTVHLHRVDPRRWIRWLSIAIVAGVVVQGVFGGSWVVKKILALAIMHGVFGQVVFAAIVSMAAFCSTTWRLDTPRVSSPKAGLDIRLTTLLPVLFLVQLVLGALYRHLNEAEGVSVFAGHALLGLHVLVAIVLTVLVLLVAIRMFSVYREFVVLRRTGTAIMIFVGGQLLLGIWAMILILSRKGEGDIPISEVVITTTHQTIGSLLLAFAVLLALWMRRLITSESA